jgi:hypothetical protein
VAVLEAAQHGSWEIACGVGDKKYLSWPCPCYFFLQPGLNCYIFHLLPKSIQLNPLSPLMYQSIDELRASSNHFSKSPPLNIAALGTQPSMHEPF